MRVVVDIETDRLHNPRQIWLVVLKDMDSGEHHSFRNVTTDVTERERFHATASQVTLWVGHNVLGFDLPVLGNLIGGSFLRPELSIWLDTLILSKLIDYPRDGHSIEDYGVEFNIPKGKFIDFDKGWSQDMEDYCVRDTDICHKVYLKYLKYLSNPLHKESILKEHLFQYKVVNSLSSNGFYFNSTKATKILADVTQQLEVLDKEILKVFPPKLKLIREVHPKETKHGTLSKSDFRFVLDGDLSEFNGGPFCRCSWSVFNPSSHKQIVEVLSSSNWAPVDKTQTHIDAERELARARYSRGIDNKDKLVYLKDKLEVLRKTGWKVNENNLNTLPDDAPLAARTLAKRILLEARRRTLTEWIDLTCHEIKVELDQFGMPGTKINGTPILSGGTSSEPRTDVGALITWKNPGPLTEKHTSNTLTDYRSKILLTWLQSKKVDAQFVKESASSTWITVTGPEQLESCCAALATVVLDGTRSIHPKYKITSNRIHGRYQGIGAWSHRMSHQNPNTANIPNDLDLAGKKKLLGKELRSLWSAPPNRLLVGVDAEGIQLRIFAHYIDDPEFTNALVNGKKSDKTDPHSFNQTVLGSVCRSRAAAKRFIFALLLGAGLGKLAEILDCSEQEAKEALERLLGRYEGFARLKQTTIPADAKRGWFTGLDGRRVRIPGDETGYRRHLCMSGYLQNGEAVVMKYSTLKWVDKLKDYDAKLVNFVHDEWQTECPNNMDIALRIAKMQADSLTEVGVELGLKCPLAGSFYNDDIEDFTIGTNWSVTH